MAVLVLETHAFKGHEAIDFFGARLHPKCANFKPPKCAALILAPILLPKGGYKVLTEEHTKQRVDACLLYVIHDRGICFTVPQDNGTAAAIKIFLGAD